MGQNVFYSPTNIARQVKGEEQIHLLPLFYGIQVVKMREEMRNNKQKTMILT